MRFGAIPRRRNVSETFPILMPFARSGMLLAFRNGGSAGLAQLLCKRFAQAHSQEEAAADADRETSITDLGASEDKITKVG
jgi:hypothetical protein